jgi:hypothetical protein
MFRQPYLILISLALFVFGSAFLFWQNERELDPDRGKDWWVISFVLPQEPADLSFVIENHSNQVGFRYEITADKEVLSQDTLSVNRGETLTITPPLDAQIGTRTVITVSSDKDKDKKEIYR